MKYDVTVQYSEYNEKHYEVEARDKKEAEEKAIAIAEKEVVEDNDPSGWKDLGCDFEVFADIEPAE
ncbi:MAG: hypothetical protein KAV00_07055 [Phycisphaerae bacterium]|nr:hypothetical protein [Phycisphaerae bacterium]